MKKSTIWILDIVMGLSFLSLLYLQISYIEEMVKMRNGQFDESVKRALMAASRMWSPQRLTVGCGKIYPKRKRERGSRARKAKEWCRHSVFTVTAPDGTKIFGYRTENV